ncbi:MAG: pyridoxal phosphate-dependent aminotransferase [Chloroflexota bacterium]|nr:pyridoxal phosphate-dependent aminotransferase [Chloroflexota bacterium]
MTTPGSAVHIAGSPNGKQAQAGNGRPGEEEQVAFVAELRKEAVQRYRPIFLATSSPIRTMARMVREVSESACKAGISPDVLAREVANRTIGDVNVRLITEKMGGVDYTTIGEDLGLILPGETIGGRTSEGAVHLELNRRQDEIESRLLRDYNWDMRVYDVFGVGNPLLREKLAARFEKAWGLPTDPERTFISIGALDALYKTILSIGYWFKQKYGSPATFGFPAPGFAVVNWQVQMFGLKLMKIHTEPNSHFKLTYSRMKEALAADQQLRLLYLTVSNNPTAFSYSYDELGEVYRALEEDGRELAVLADLAYIGTGDPQEDKRRMQSFHTPFALHNTIFINSLSKVFTLTGDRCGWASLENPEWAELMRAAWNNTTAGLPAEWQLRFTAYIEWFDEHPEIQEKIKALYDLRREDFRRQLQEQNAHLDIFENIGMDDHATIYNWSKLKPGEDALSLFEKTGIAGVSGSAFGYDDSYIRFSVGFIPAQI